jgi:thiol-disulfide isomerase/thioredoxin
LLQWCGPCKAISPSFDKLAQQHEGSASIIFAKCDVDKAKDVAQACGITAMPTFQFFKNGAKVDEVKGADVQQLNTKIGYYTAAVLKEPAESSKSATGNASATAAPGSLRSLINVEGGKLLNASNLSSIRNIASPPPAGFAVSSASGAKVLIHIPFTSPVTPSHIKITVPANSTSNAPSRVLVGTNVPLRPVVKAKDGSIEDIGIDMESLTKAENTQAFNVYSDEYTNGTTELKLKASKFKGIKSLTIRIDANLSGEEKTISKIGDLDIIGVKA